MKKVLSSLRDGLRNPAFDLTVDKPPGGPSGDLNSQMHGEAKKQMVFAFRQFLEALKGWEIASGEAARVLQLRMLHTACLNLRLAIGKRCLPSILVPVDKSPVEGRRMTFSAPTGSIAADFRNSPGAIIEIPQLIDPVSCVI